MGVNPHLGVDIRGAEGAPIVAARDGTVWSVGETERGHSVVLDHGPPWATFYQHLKTVAVEKGQTVKAGDVIGTMGHDPTDAQLITHLHFATWYKGAGNAASVDPAPMLAVARLT